MNRYCIEIAFDGTNYHGWQNQPNAISVQEVLEKNISILCQEKMILVGASRTDAGVHIKQTYAHFDYDKELPSYFMRRLNFMLPADIAVNSIRKVSDVFHTRFDAIQRTYHYYINYKKNPFNINKAYLYPYERVNIDAMNEACAYLQTQKDFEAFCKRQSDNRTTYCRIDFMQWTLENENELVFCVKADRYLRGMVKGLVGTMLKVGRGIYNIDDLKKIMLTQDKSMVSFAVPGSALYLTEVRYAQEFYDIPVL